MQVWHNCHDLLNYLNSSESHLWKGNHNMTRKILIKNCSRKYFDQKSYISCPYLWFPQVSTWTWPLLCIAPGSGQSENVSFQMKFWEKKFLKGKSYGRSRWCWNLTDVSAAVLQMHQSNSNIILKIKHELSSDCGILVRILNWELLSFNDTNHCYYIVSSKLSALSLS